jgi:5-oxoprolinase (ATP-hydrolysing)
MSLEILAFTPHTSHLAPRTSHLAPRTSHLALHVIHPTHCLYLTPLVSALKRPIDTAQVRTDLEALYAEGYRSIAIVLCHSYLYPLHEKAVESIALSVGFPHISVSSDLQAMINLVSRGTSATADAYLTPEVRRYLDGFAEGFKGKLQQNGGSGTGCRVSFMQSDGSLCDFRKFSGLKAILCEWSQY